MSGMWGNRGWNEGNMGNGGRNVGNQGGNERNVGNQGGKVRIGVAVCEIREIQVGIRELEWGCSETG